MNQVVFDGLCIACHKSEAWADSFLCLECLPEPAAEPAPDVWQPALLLEATA